MLLPPTQPVNAQGPAPAPRVAKFPRSAMSARPPDKPEIRKSGQRKTAQVALCGFLKSLAEKQCYQP